MTTMKSLQSLSTCTFFLEEDQMEPEQHKKKATPRFSVIICTYNRRNLLLSALASLRRQTLPFTQFEVIVVDNGSTDGTLEAIETYTQAADTTSTTYITHDSHTTNATNIQRHQPGTTANHLRIQCLTEARNGLAYARSTALRVATGDISVFLDDDTVASPHFLERLQLAYEETGADAIGGRVEIRWEAARPHWLTEDLLEMLGYFAPFRSRASLPDTLCFSSCNFSVKMAALQKIGHFMPFLGKRVDAPVSMEIEDICRRLRQAGYTLWYEPMAEVMHRAVRTRLNQAFFVGRSYWQGRSEILARYAEIDPDGGVPCLTTLRALHTMLPEIGEIAKIALIHRPLLFLAQRSTSEHVLASMAQARSWGRIRQQLSLLNSAPTMHIPAILLVHAHEPEALLLAQGLLARRVHCTLSVTGIPLSWLWQHRRRRDEPRHILHVYRPGAFDLTYWQRQWLLLCLWLAQLLGLRIVTTDAGGWWQGMRGVHFLARRTFEQKLLACSSMVLTYTLQPEQLYPDQKLRQRVHSLPHPGLRGSCPDPILRTQACIQLGLPPYAGFAYICFAHLHTEREILYLIQSFSEARSILQEKKRQTGQRNILPQLLLVGQPRDTKEIHTVLQRAAHDSAIHVFVEYHEEDIPLYIGAADALVMPHLALQTAGVVETALLFHAYERVVIVPDLPRFRGILPENSSVTYDASSRSSLIKALIDAPTYKFHLKKKDLLALDARNGWQHYATRLLEIYHSS